MINPTISATKKVLINAKAPEGYIAGLGRGATGFTTRSDIGPARLASSEEQTPPPGYVAGRGRGAAPVQHVQGLGAGILGQQPPQERDDSAAYNDAKFDKWSGFNDAGLFAGTAGDHEDDEADKLWDEIDDVMDKRRKRRREEKEKQVAEQLSELNPKISVQFADAKRKLSEISEEQWMNLPEVGDYSIKRRKMEQYTPVPDSVLSRAIQSQASQHHVVETPGTATVANLRSFGEARESIMLNQLKKVEDSVTGKTTVNPKNYLSGLASINILGDAEIGDLKRARELLSNVTITNPKHAPGWIARARVEVYAGKMAAARSIIMQGCETCSDNEDIWIEAAKLQTPETAKKVLAQAVQHIPKSVNIWIEAAKLEKDKKSKRRVLRKALEIIPTSVALWKEAIAIEDEEDAKVMLARATEVLPQQVDLWLALARLETYQNAKKILNNAVKNLPNEALVWIAAAHLEEENGNKNIETIIKRAISMMQQNKVAIKREEWIHHAFKSEDSEHLETCRAIIRCTIGIGIEEASRKHTWLKDAKTAASVDPDSKKTHLETARAIYAHALSIFPTKKSVWRRAAQLEKELGTSETLLDVLKRALEMCPHAEDMWLMAAKEKWLAGDIDGARQFLVDSFTHNKNNEDIWLAAVKIEYEANEISRARELLVEARKQANTARVWMKSAILERSVNNLDSAKSLLQQGLQAFPQFEKMWMMLGQIEECKNEIDKAREAYVKGLKNCPNSIPLWRCAIKLESNLLNFSRARALLEKARLRNPKNDTLWLITVRVEYRAAVEESKQKQGVIDTTVAMAQLAKGLQECPSSGILLAESIELEPRAKQRAQAALALKSCDKDPSVITAVTTLFWKERKLDKARDWFERSVALNPDFGDAWIYYYKFEMEQGTDETREALAKKCEAADPHHGELWTFYSKNVENHKLKCKDVLVKAAAKLDINQPRYTFLI